MARLKCSQCGADLGDAEDPYRDPDCMDCLRKSLLEEEGDVDNYSPDRCEVCNEYENECVCVEEVDSDPPGPYPGPLSEAEYYEIEKLCRSYGSAAVRRALNHIDAVDSQPQEG